MNAIRGTFRPWVVVALIVWIVGLGTALIFRGGSVSTILSTVGSGPETGTGGGWHWLDDGGWEAIWLLGVLAIIAIGFLTRKRA